ncbi:sugar porter family MFS transporter [Nocardioides sp. GY 10113]|uniref:sugar porter family MFS transporter n=1 Tax=Nocardioides sp. GY 10113 TaxID=2569761 RepID=UPI0010A79A67|nr:sugar porter family MFS transporter [Nocardioides sp. GY 10113]TIC85919.1 sugar porter family MFS transporter [Nocardioides sp. GY 10113]
MTSTQMDRPAKTSRYVYAVGLVLLLCGLLFGYDQGVISGALGGIKEDFDPSTLVIEIITSWVTLGAMVGALAAGVIADRLGRRAALMLAAAIFVVGTLLEAFAPGTVVLTIGRLVLGAGVGIASVAGPLYGSENAAARDRGRMVSMYQMAVTVGIFLAYWANYLLIENSTWRVMLAIAALPAVLLVLAIVPLRDSATWYVKVGRIEEAEDVVRRAEPEADPATRIREISEAIAADEQADWGEVFSARWRKPLVVAAGLAVLQQLSGINAIIYYANVIFAAAGFDSPTQQSLATLWAVGGVNVVATLVAVFWVDRFGRKPLLTIGSWGMLLSLLLVAGAFFRLDKVTTSDAASGAPGNAGHLALVGMVVFIASFAFSLGPIVWTVINEVFPAQVRGKGVATATALNWMAAWLVTQFFLSVVEFTSTSTAFLMFAGFCGVTLWFNARFIPETKGRTLEEVQRMWEDPKELQRAIRNRY